MSDLFDRARPAAIAEAVSVCSSPGAFRKNGELWSRNPTREDRSVGSFSINVSTGLWHDFADDSEGDAFDLVAAVRGKALGDVARELEGKPAPRPAPRQEKSEEVIPWVPMTEADLPKLRQALAGMVPEGELTNLWPYYDAEGRIPFAILRWQVQGDKAIRPGIKCANGTYCSRQPLKTGRPLYGLRELLAHPGAPVLLVEGEKCADVATHYLRDADSSRIAITWAHGANAWDGTDFTPLQDREVVIWPDADPPGLEVARKIAAHLDTLGCRVGVITPPSGVKQGWDIADANAEDWNPEKVIKFIEAVPLKGVQGRPMGEVLHRGFSEGADNLIPSGWSTLDMLLEGGFRLGGYTVVTGETGHGKSTWLSQLALHLIHRGEMVWLGSFEMRAFRVGKIMMVQAGMLPTVENVERFDREVLRGNLHVSETLGVLDPDAMAREMRHFLRKGCRHFLIDNLAVLEAIESGERYEKQTRLMQNILRFSLENTVHLYVAAHLKKDIQGRPAVTDISGAATIGQLAENCLMIRKNEPKDDEGPGGYLYILKSRTGGMGKSIKLRFDSTRETFEEEGAF